MKVLLINPYAQFNYKAPFVPIGLLSIASYLRTFGHEILFYNRCFDKTPVKKILADFHPDVCGVSIVSGRTVKDGMKVSAELKAAGITTVWGGSVPSANYREALACGLCDIVSIGEGEMTWRELLDVLSRGEDLRDVRGIAYKEKDGSVTVTETREPADLAAMPCIDWSLDDPEKYMHPYLMCKKMMYVYSGKGCPGNCTFCSNPVLHAHTFRRRPDDAVLDEVEYLIKNHGLDGVYFSDECWYTRKEDIYRFCGRVRERGLTFFWGCEMRAGILEPEVLKAMYDSGCRWLFFGMESGSPEMLKKIKKNITVEQIKESVRYCKDIGILPIVSFILGYPDETPEQLAATVDLIAGLDAGVNAVNIFTPVVQSELFNELVAAEKYKAPSSFEELSRILVAERSDYRCDTVPYRDLKVIKSYFLWKSFTKKESTKEARSFAVALNSVKDALHNLTSLGFKGFFTGAVIIAKEFSDVFFYAIFFPGIRKKYGLTNPDISSKK